MADEAEIIIIEADTLEEAREKAQRLFPDYKIVKHCVLCHGEDPHCLLCNAVTPPEGTKYNG